MKKEKILKLTKAGIPRKKYSKSSRVFPVIHYKKECISGVLQYSLVCYMLNTPLTNDQDRFFRFIGIIDSYRVIHKESSLETKRPDGLIKLVIHHDSYEYLFNLCHRITEILPLDFFVKGRLGNRTSLESF